MRSKVFQHWDMSGIAKAKIVEEGQERSSGPGGKGRRVFGVDL